MEKISINKYYNSLRSILKDRQELFYYFDERVKIDKLQKKANLRLFFKMPIFYFLRSVLYLPINLSKLVKKISNHYYLLKMDNEIKVLKDELNSLEKKENLDFKLLK
ncbi:hypothetical protein OAB44_00590 [Pelagibacteraceae bacterium]|nr:hypothetical protein [Pelagibacteraceae bacterium]